MQKQDTSDTWRKVVQAASDGCSAVEDRKMARGALWSAIVAVQTPMLPGSGLASATSLLSHAMTYAVNSGAVTEAEAECADPRHVRISDNIREDLLVRAALNSICCDEHTAQA